eukprot:scaffold267382_cov31-Tisochrysis_lutea.AAC.3
MSVACSAISAGTEPPAATLSATRSLTARVADRTAVCGSPERGGASRIHFLRRSINADAERGIEGGVPDSRPSLSVAEEQQPVAVVYAGALLQVSCCSEWPQWEDCPCAHFPHDGRHAPAVSDVSMSEDVVCGGRACEILDSSSVIRETWRPEQETSVAESAATDG